MIMIIQYMAQSGFSFKNGRTAANDSMKAKLKQLQRTTAIADDMPLLLALRLILYYL